MSKGTKKSSILWMERWTAALGKMLAIDSLRKKKKKKKKKEIILWIYAALVRMALDPFLYNNGPIFSFGEWLSIGIFLFLNLSTLNHN